MTPLCGRAILHRFRLCRPLARPIPLAIRVFAGVLFAATGGPFDSARSAFLHRWQELSPGSAQDDISATKMRDFAGWGVIC
jgi:hypothetical protein